MDNASLERNNYFELPAGLVYNDGKWHHFALVREAGRGLNAYLDGIQLIRKAYPIQPCFRRLQLPSQSKQQELPLGNT